MKTEEFEIGEMPIIIDEQEDASASATAETAERQDAESTPTAQEPSPTDADIEAARSEAYLRGRNDAIDEYRRSGGVPFRTSLPEREAEQHSRPAIEFLSHLRPGFWD